jgi:hypothetical protein
MPNNSKDTSYSSPQTQKQFVQSAKGKLGVDTTNNFSLVSEFKGYRNKEDITNLIPGIITLGSQNVLSTTGGRFGVRKGYALDGDAGVTGEPITSSYDWARSLGDSRHIRVTGTTLQVRYSGSGGEVWGTTTFTAGQVKWLPIKTMLGQTVNAADYWSVNEVKSLLLMVDGSANIYDWTGAIATASSAGTSTITVSGSKTWAEYGFMLGTSVTPGFISGTTQFTYTGISGTSITGVSPNPSSIIGSGSLIIQTPATTTNVQAGIGLPGNDLISVLKNQVYVAANDNYQVYISKTNDFKVYTYSSPRRVGEGALLTLDGAVTAMIPQENSMYISAGKDYWYNTKFTLSSDNSSEAIEVEPLKTNPNQAAQSQALCGKTKNSVFFVSFDPILDELGRVENILFTPQTSNLSDPILNDFNDYDFTGGSVQYFKYFMYIAVPRENKVLIYNMAKGYWECPQILPVSRFSIIDNALYGHSSQTNETYKLFDGYNDNGQPIDAKVNFSYQNYGTRANTKYFDEFYIEGYISGTAELGLGITYEIDGKATTTNHTIYGDDGQVVALKNLLASLGKKDLGKNPIGSYYNPNVDTGLPPKFRVIKTFPRTDFYEAQYSFSSYGKDWQWEILAFGPLVTATMYGNNDIKQ